MSLGCEGCSSFLSSETAHAYICMSHVCFFCFSMSAVFACTRGSFTTHDRFKRNPSGVTSGGKSRPMSLFKWALSGLPIHSFLYCFSITLSRNEHAAGPFADSGGVRMTYLSLFCFLLDLPGQLRPCLPVGVRRSA